MDWSQLGDLVSRLALREGGRTEADIQSDVRAVLLSGALSLKDSDLEVQGPSLEAQVGDGSLRRIDIEAGFCVIEIKKKLTASVVAEAIADQLPGYVATREAQTGARYTGLLTDGRSWRLYRYATGKLHEVRAFNLSPNDPEVDGLIAWLEAVFATQQDVPPTPDNVAQLLGSTSPGFALDSLSLRDVYERCKDDPEVQLKRELWAKSLSTALGTQFEKEDEDDSLFVNHTYLVTVAEIVAHAVVGFNVSDADSVELLNGALFTKAGIRGVVEADFFDWIVDNDAAIDAGGVRFVTELSRRVGRFDWSNVQHDVLKTLYESVIAPETRHALGEYYTPDWLAAEVVARVADSPLQQRIMDPSCGSGTFLFAAIRLIADRAREAGWDDAATLEHILGHVYGLDLHPVAVTLARVTYLLAIGNDMLLARKPTGVAVPVFLGDALQWDRADEETLLGTQGLVVATADGLELFANELRFPDAVLADAQVFDGLVADMADRATNRKRGSAVRKLSATFFKRHKVGPDEQSVIQSTFRVMCELHDHHRNHIWGYYVRNLARPLWLAREPNQVDVLVGNPPWLAYRYMPPRLQEQFKIRGDSYDVRPKGKLSTHADLAALFVVSTTSSYLRKGGRFGFVMPRGALGGPHYKRFRTGTYPKGSARTLAFHKPWDLVGVRPHLFPVPSCVVFGERGAASDAMPSTALSWVGDAPGTDPRSVRAEIVKAPTEIINADAGPASPYHDEANQGTTLVPRSLVLVVDGDAGPFGDVHGMRTVRSRRGGDQEPWKTLPDLQASVESEFLMRAVLGACIAPYRLLATELAALPWDGNRLLEAQSPELEQYPGIANWWNEASKRFQKHGSGAMTLTERNDYQGTLSSQFPIPPIRVIYTTSGTWPAATILTDTSIIVESSLYWLQAQTESEANYLTAFLNSRALLDQFSPLQPTGQFGTRHFHRYPFYPRVPRFDPKITAHCELAELAQTSADTVAELDLGSAKFVAARKAIRQHLKSVGLAGRIDSIVAQLTTT